MPLVYGAAHSCQVKGGLFGCKKATAGVCIYCGRAFCAEHGVLLEDHQEVCNRKNCAAKREDLAKHVVWRAAVYTRNREQQCGVEGCAQKPQGECSRCQGFFCEGHIDIRNDVEVVNNVQTPRVVSLCEHCWMRRPIWLRS